MALVFVTGGARSGKSQFAVSLARGRPDSVTFLATGQAGDHEMTQRIARHRRGRPRHWKTVEEPLRLGSAIAAADPGDTLIIDCLSLWVANLLASPEAEQSERLAARAAALAHDRPALTVAVTNEVGMGIVPAYASGRRYRDVLGRVNAIWAAAAKESVLIVAGRSVRLGDPVQVPGLAR